MICQMFHYILRLEEGFCFVPCLTLLSYLSSVIHSVKQCLTLLFCHCCFAVDRSEYKPTSTHYHKTATNYLRNTHLQYACPPFTALSVHSNTQEQAVNADEEYGASSGAAGNNSKKRPSAQYQTIFFRPRTMEGLRLHWRKRNSMARPKIKGLSTPV